jgi:hypothetical protein
MLPRPILRALGQHGRVPEFAKGLGQASARLGAFGIDDQPERQHPTSQLAQVERS